MNRNLTDQIIEKLWIDIGARHGHVSVEDKCWYRYSVGVFTLSDVTHWQRPKAALLCAMGDL